MNNAPRFRPGERFVSAFTLAVQAHADQVRKSTTVPYVSHLMAVAALVMDYGGDEDQSIAGLLHDAVEDGGSHYEALIRERFGNRVADMVMACTDGVQNEMGEKAPWCDRKEAYLAHLVEANADVLLVSGCDKLSNAQSILADLQQIGVKVFDRFNARQEETLWYYRSLADVFAARNAPMAGRLRATVAQIDALANA